jgi:hypothetical protein
MSTPEIRQHESEPVPGLPERLPEGERLLWQGRPSRRRVMTDVLKARWVAFYFGLLIVWALAAGWSDGRTMASILFSAGVLCILAAILLGLMELYAWAITRTTLYTVTNRRLVMRVGVGSSITLNLPFHKIASAAMVERKDGSGDIVFEAADGVRLSWFHLWPHVRPRHFSKPQAALRCISGVSAVAALIVDELRAAHAEAAGEPVPERTAKAPIPVRRRGRVEAQPAHA